MQIVARYSFNGGEEAVQSRYPALLAEVEAVISRVDASKHLTKASRERTMAGRMLYSPASINRSFRQEFGNSWMRPRVSCTYSTAHYAQGYAARTRRKRAGKSYREMDFVKENLGVEVQFGKYAFMVYNVCAKMTIFHKLGYIDTGIEIVPVKGFAEDMSTGVSFFEQFAWDLEARGSADIDIPVLILGIDSN
jgi:hypothetical protein